MWRPAGLCWYTWGAVVCGPSDAPTNEPHLEEEAVDERLDIQLSKSAGEGVSCEVRVPTSIVGDEVLADGWRRAADWALSCFAGVGYGIFRGAVTENWLVLGADGAGGGSSSFSGGCWPAGNGAVPEWVENPPCAGEDSRLRSIGRLREQGSKGPVASVRGPKTPTPFPCGPVYSLASARGGAASNDSHTPKERNSGGADRHDLAATLVLSSVFKTGRCRRE